MLKTSLRHVYVKDLLVFLHSFLYLFLNLSRWSFIFISFFSLSFFQWWICGNPSSPHCDRWILNCQNSLAIWFFVIPIKLIICNVLSCCQCGGWNFYGGCQEFTGKCPDHIHFLINHPSNHVISHLLFPSLHRCWEMFLLNRVMSLSKSTIQKTLYWRFPWSPMLLSTKESTTSWDLC